MNRKKNSRLPYNHTDIVCSKFFDHLYQEENNLLVADDAAENEINFLKSAVPLKHSDKILDLGCGYGRHSLALKKIGLHVIGFDISINLLRVAKIAAITHGLRLDLMRGNMLQLPFKDKFNVVLSLFASFGYLLKDDKVAIREISEVIVKNGKFILDVHNREQYIKTVGRKDWYELPDHSFILTKRQFEPLTGVMRILKTKVTASGEKEEYQLALRIYTTAELVEMCESNGLAVENIFGDYDRRPYELDSRRCLIITKKISKSY